VDQTSAYQVGQEHVGEDRPLLSIIMEATSDEFDDVIRIAGIVETMENMSANGINAEEVGQNIQEVESMKQKVQDSLDEFMSMVVNGNYEEERPEQFGEVAELVAKVKADFGPFQLEMVEERNACMFTPHRMPEPVIPPAPRLLLSFIIRDDGIGWRKPRWEKWMGKKSRDKRTLAEQIQDRAIRKPVPSGGQMVTPIHSKEAENRTLAWVYYWGKSLPDAASKFDYVEIGGQELRADKAEQEKNLLDHSAVTSVLPAGLRRLSQEEISTILEVAEGSKPSGSVFTDRKISFESMETEKPVGSDTASLEPVAEKLDQNYLEFQSAAMPMVDLASPKRMLKNTDKTDT